MCDRLFNLQIGTKKENVLLANIENSNVEKIALKRRS